MDTAELIRLNLAAAQLPDPPPLRVCLRCGGRGRLWCCGCGDSLVRVAQSPAPPAQPEPEPQLSLADLTEALAPPVEPEPEPPVDPWSQRPQDPRLDVQLRWFRSLCLQEALEGRSVDQASKHLGISKRMFFYYQKESV